MKNLSTTYFAGGCFWCLEAVFESLKGVARVTSGYAGGQMEKPTYAAISSGDTGHVEVVKVEYDPAIITYEDLLKVFFGMHDPTTVNRQGPDVGEQYSSMIFYTSEEERRVAESHIKKLTEEKVFDAPIVTEVAPLEKFFEAEKYHQDYYSHNVDKPYCQLLISPKLAKLRKEFAPLLKDTSAAA